MDPAVSSCQACTFIAEQRPLGHSKAVQQHSPAFTSGNTNTVRCLTPPLMQSVDNVEMIQPRPDAIGRQHKWEKAMLFPSLATSGRLRSTLHLGDAGASDNAAFSTCSYLLASNDSASTEDFSCRPIAASSPQLTSIAV
jgi:hypothetical protein